MSAPHATYRRELGLGDLTMVSLGGIIGSGWLLASVVAAGTAGPAAIISWLIGAVGVILIGLCYAELGGMIPQSGGILRYPQYTHSTLVSFITSWSAFVAWAAVPAIEAAASVQFLARTANGGWIPGIFVGGQLTFWGFIMALALLVLFIIINTAGVRLLRQINTPLTWWKLALPLLTVVVLLITAHHGGNLSDKAAGGFMPYGLNGTLSAVATSGIIFSYLGFRQAVDLAGEAKNPGRDVPRAVILAILIGAAVYVLLQLAFLLAVPGADLAKGWAALALPSSNLSTAPFAQMATVLNLGWLAFLLRVDGFLSPSGTGLVYTASTARAAFAMTANRFFPRVFGRLSRSGVPYPALILDLLIGFAFLLPFPSWQKLVGFVSSAVVLTYIIGPIAVSTLRRTAADLPRPVRIGGLQILAPLAFIVASLIIYWSGWSVDSVVLGVALGGLIIYLLYFDLRFAAGEWDVGEITRGLWLVGYLVALGVVSYLGTFGGNGTLPGPWDQLLVIALAIVGYYVGLTYGYPTRYLEQARRDAPDLQTARIDQPEVTDFGQVAL